MRYGMSLHSVVPHSQLPCEVLASPAGSNMRFSFSLTDDPATGGTPPCASESIIDRGSIKKDLSEVNPDLRSCLTHMLGET